MSWILVLVITSQFIGTPGGSRVTLQTVPGFRSLTACRMAGKKLAKKYSYENDSSGGVIMGEMLMSRSAEPMCTPDAVK